MSLIKGNPPRTATVFSFRSKKVLTNPQIKNLQNKAESKTTKLAEQIRLNLEVFEEEGYDLDYAMMIVPKPDLDDCLVLSLSETNPSLMAMLDIAGLGVEKLASAITEPPDDPITA